MDPPSYYALRAAFSKHEDRETGDRMSTRVCAWRENVGSPVPDPSGLRRRHRETVRGAVGLATVVDRGRGGEEKHSSLRSVARGIAPGEYQRREQLVGSSRCAALSFSPEVGGLMPAQEI